jgi:hypothetical protein
MLALVRAGGRGEGGGAGQAPGRQQPNCASLQCASLAGSQVCTTTTARVQRHIQPSATWQPVTHLQHPLGQRNLSIVAHVAAAGMEAHHHLKLQAQRPHQRKQLAVPRPVVPPGPPLHRAPLRQAGQAQGRQVSMVPQRPASQECKY